MTWQLAFYRTSNLRGRGRESGAERDVGGRRGERGREIEIERERERSCCVFYGLLLKVAYHYFRHVLLLVTQTNSGVI